MKKFAFRRPWALVALVGFVLVIAFTIIGLYGSSGTPKVDTRMKVAATIYPVYDFVREIGGNRVNVVLLLPEGESPEALVNLYNGVDLSGTRAVFAVGLGYDTEGIPEEHQSRIVTLEDGIDLLLQQGTEGSPYYWLSVKNAQQMARTIADRLSAIDPAGSSLYAMNRDVLLSRLEELDDRIRDLFAAVPKRQMVVYGYDWGYFAREYDLSIIEYEPAGNIEASRVDDLIDAASSFGLIAIFSDIRLPSEAFLPALAQQYFSIYHLDIFGGVEDRLDYVSTMAYNARSLYDGLMGAP